MNAKVIKIVVNCALGLPKVNTGSCGKLHCLMHYQLTKKGTQAAHPIVLLVLDIVKR